MSGDTERDELRALQARAYGREGGLDAAGLARLQELEGRRAVEASEPAADAVPTRDVAAGEADGADHPSAGVAEPEATESPEPAADDAAGGPEDPPVPMPVSPSAPRWRSFLSPRVALAAVVLLALGAGIGWVVFGRSAEAEIPLTAAQYERRAELSEKAYDNGSVRAIAQKDEALVWIAGRNGGKLVCLILDVGEQSVEDCQPLEAAKQNGMNTMAVSAVVDEEAAEEGSATATISAYLLFSTTGEPMVSIQRWDNGNSGWLDQFEGEERDRAQALVEEGYDDQSPTIVGYLQDAPVWLVTRTATTGVSEHCLIADANPAADHQPACADMMEAFETGLATMVPDPGNDETSETGIVWILRLGFTQWQTPYLTITREEVHQVTYSFDEPIPIEIDESTGDAGG